MKDEADLKIIETIKNELMIKRVGGSGNRCEKCGGSGEFGAIASYRGRRHNYLICGWCKYVEKSALKTVKCRICKGYELTDLDRTIYHRGCRLRDALGEDTCKRENGLLVFDMKKVAAKINAKRKGGAKHGYRKTVQ